MTGILSACVISFLFHLKTLALLVWFSTSPAAWFSLSVRLSTSETKYINQKRPDGQKCCENSLVHLGPLVVGLEHIRASIWVLSNSHFVVHYVTLWLNVCMRQDWSLVFCKAPQQMKPWLLEEISLGIYLLTLLGSPKLTELPGIRARMYLCFLNSVGLGLAKGGGVAVIWVWGLVC